jgi:hypothetical protein
VPRETRPVIAGFGARDWEQFGLWPTLDRVADFHLSLYGSEYADGPAGTAQQVRQRNSRGFLKYVEAIEAERPVNAAFFYASGMDFDLDVVSSLSSRGIWTIVMGLDDKHQFLSNRDGSAARQLQLAGACDLYWTTWRTGTAIVSRHGGTPWFAPTGADPAFHRPIAVDRDIDVLFIGQAYGARADLVRYLKKREFRVEAYGAGWPNGFVTFDRSVELYSRAHVVLGMGGVGHMQGVKHLKGRDFEVPMCGALYLTSYNPELTDFFEIGREILCYASFEECADLLHWLLRHPADAQAIRRAALARSLRDHTWEHRFNTLFSLLTNGS